MKSPFKSPLCYALPVVLVALTHFAVWPLKGTRVSYIWAAISNRGPMPYFILYFTFRNLIAYIMARMATSTPPSFSKQFLVYSFFPLAFGLMGTIMGWGSVIVEFMDFIAGAAELTMIKDAFASLLIAFSIAFDTMILGLLGTILSLIWYCGVLGMGDKTTSEPV